jgi:hypothetical protein
MVRRELVQNCLALFPVGGGNLSPRFLLPRRRALMPAWQSLGANEDVAKQRVSRVIAFSARRGRHHFHAGQIVVELFHPGRP